MQVVTGQVIASYVMAFMCTFIATWILIPLAHKIGYVDKPGGRKQHQGAIPLVGGVAIFCGLFLSLLFLPLDLSLRSYRGLLAGSVILVFFGVIDDLVDLNAKLRLLVQIVAALVATAWTGHYLSYLGDLLGFGIIILSYFGILLTLFLAVAYFNAFNMLDGRDGLAGLVGLGQLVLLIHIAFKLQLVANVRVMSLFLVTIIVYLLFNINFFCRKTTKIFMGDAGSTFIALVLVYFMVKLSQVSRSPFQPMVFLWIAAYPIFDLAAVSIGRMKRGESPFKAGRDHMHHVIERLGIPTTWSVLMIFVFSVGLGLFGLLLNFWHIAEWISFLLYVVGLLLYIFASSRVRVFLVKKKDHNV